MISDRDRFGAHVGITTCFRDKLSLKKQMLPLLVSCQGRYTLIVEVFAKKALILFHFKTIKKLGRILHI